MISSTNHVVNFITQLGDIGVLIGMFLESSVVPIPSEVIIIGASSFGIPLAAIVFLGSLGSTLGGMVGYCLGRYAAMPVILKYGRFVLIKPHHIERAEKIAKKYGIYSVLIGRVLPIVPFKVFSIAAGITKIPFIPFMICTLVGVVPRIFLLAIFGLSLAKYTKPTLMIVGGIILIFLAYKLSQEFYKSVSRKKPRS